MKMAGFHHVFPLEPKMEEVLVASRPPYTANID